MLTSVATPAVLRLARADAPQMTLKLHHAFSAVGSTPNSVSKVGLTVNVTGAAPTGQVFNSDPNAFVVSDSQGNSGSSLFLFDTENGTIDGWSPERQPERSLTRPR